MEYACHIFLPCKQFLFQISPKFWYFFKQKDKRDISKLLERKIDGDIEWVTNTSKLDRAVEMHDKLLECSLKLDLDSSHRGFSHILNHAITIYFSNIC